MMGRQILDWSDGCGDDGTKEEGVKDEYREAIME